MKKDVSVTWAALAVLALFGFSSGAPAAAEPGPAVRVGDAPQRRVEALSGDRVLFQSPQEGLWSVAAGWKDGWPDDWRHAQVKDVQKVGDWTVVTGAIEMPQGRLELRDSYRVEGGLIRGVRRFTWTGKEPLPQCTLSVRWLAPGAKNAKPLLPGICYYGNPMGARTGAGAVAVHTGKPGEESIYEEHRYAAPFASIEWSGDGAWRGAALHTVPSMPIDANRRDQWWSLGLVARDGACELVSLSGPCASNGRHSVVKAFQGRFTDYPDTWLNLRPGTIVEKTFFLEAYPVAKQGSGFRTPLRTAMALNPPWSVDGLPTLEQIVRDKYRFACSRFRDRPKDPGFHMFPGDGSEYVMGWCGQAAAPGYALLALAKRLDDPKARDMAVRSLNFLATASFNEHGFLLRYSASSGNWSEQNAVSQGQAMENFARAILIARKQGGVDTKPWEAFLQKACEVHADRILRDDWRPVSTNEGFFVSPLCKGFALFGDERFKRAAVKAAEHYAQRHLDMTEPYWGGTLDAQCEDKEGAWAAFQAFLAVYELTKEPRYLQWAEHAMDAAITYTVLWDIDMPPGRLRDHGFQSRGWTIVSAQNQHLDVFGVISTPDIWRMGDYLRREDLKRLAAVMYRSCGQILDPWGSQGEQMQHTNFIQSGDMSDTSRVRGGYAEHWTVFWITAHFLNAAAQFEEMGVDLDRGEAK
jgi:hypothetical protein